MIILYFFTWSKFEQPLQQPSLASVCNRYFATYNFRRTAPIGCLFNQPLLYCTWRNCALCNFFSSNECLNIQSWIEKEYKIDWAWLKTKWKTHRNTLGVILLIQHLYSYSYWKVEDEVFLTNFFAEIPMLPSAIFLKIEKEAKELVTVFIYNIKRKNNKENIYFVFYSWAKCYKLFVLIIYSFLFHSNSLFIIMKGKI